MKLSKQERIAAIVVIVLIILVAGGFLFVKPNIETINETKTTLAAKEKEYNDAVAKAGTKEALKESILNAYDKGKNMADMFYPELSAYEADNEFREFLSTCKANVLVEDIEVTSPSTAGLSTSVFVPTDVQYALKDYVNQGGSTEITDPRLVRQAMIQSSLGEAQTIGATSVTFTLKATTKDDLLLFADEVNRYKKGSMRKSIELNTIDFTDDKITDEYDAMAKAILDQAEEAAAKVFKDKTGHDLSGFTNNNNNNNNNTQTPTTPDANGSGTTPGSGSQGGDTETEEKLSHYYYEMPCTITFYSIERMQDPSDTLKAQDVPADGSTAS